MKKILILVLFVFLLIPQNATAFGVTFLGSLGGYKLTNDPRFDGTKWGITGKLAADLEITDLIAIEGSLGYVGIQVSAPALNGTSIEYKPLSYLPVNLGVKLSPLHFLPIINPYVVLGTGYWREKFNDNSESLIGGLAALGLELKGGCFGVDLRGNVEKPSLKDTGVGYSVILSGIFYLGI